MDTLILYITYTEIIVTTPHLALILNITSIFSICVWNDCKSNYCIKMLTFLIHKNNLSQFYIEQP